MRVSVSAHFKHPSKEDNFEEAFLPQNRTDLCIPPCKITHDSFEWICLTGSLGASSNKTISCPVRIEQGWVSSVTPFRDPGGQERPLQKPDLMISVTVAVEARQ